MKFITVKKKISKKPIFVVNWDSDCGCWFICSCKGRRGKKAARKGVGRRQNETK
jgi:hypothetical protein